MTLTEVKVKSSKKSVFIKLSCNSKSEPTLVVMPLEIKRHTIPYLKALNSDLEPSTKIEHGSNFTQHHTTLKNTHFPS